ncbi:MAG: hypothetical protein K0V04_11375 [Deltaproteobacteria bacterium]|nr:hypothetical protein [Deltaproteobacteria bacterium]
MSVRRNYSASEEAIRWYSRRTGSGRGWSHVMRLTVAAAVFAVGGACDTAEEPFGELIDDREDGCPSDGNCTSEDYVHDEATNPLGSNQCSTDCECDGARTCSQWGWCQGTSRGDSCTSTDYFHDEATNPLGSNQCSNSCECDGARTCSPWGWCQGTSR